MLADSVIQQLAQHLHDSRLARRETTRLTEAHPDLDLDAAYRVMRAGIALRTAAGETVVGYKMGLTSKAKREQMNLASPVYGVLTDRMRVPDGGTFRVAGGIHPKVEPEIAFHIARELEGHVSREEALAACDGVCAALEILDSRFAGFKYFSLPDVVADNSSSSHFVLAGEWRSSKGLDLAALSMRMSVDGVMKQSASSNAISGDPVLSLVQLVEMLAAQGEVLPAGSIVLAGAATVAEQLAPGQEVVGEVEGLASVRVRAV
ncbi:MAG: fumarylacetoacetate hydrolase family protein [Myxococcaceae bacterium]|nr:fumarylacetoacetate hydrolase family protein [Myxococcaceae bacterium]